MTPIERGQLWVMRVNAAIMALVMLIAAVVGGGILARETGFPHVAIVAPVALLLIYPVLIAPRRAWRAWGYRVGERELALKRGVWTEVATTVPFGRVQHLDVAQGPVERAFGVCRLLLHTAGTAHSLVELPGLTRATAEALRDDIRAHIREHSA